jgi:TolA-binding protein
VLLLAVITVCSSAAVSEERNASEEHHVSEENNKIVDSLVKLRELKNSEQAGLEQLQEELKQENERIKGLEAELKAFESQKRLLAEGLVDFLQTVDEIPAENARELDPSSEDALLRTSLLQLTGDESEEELLKLLAHYENLESLDAAKESVGAGTAEADTAEARVAQAVGAVGEVVWETGGAAGEAEEGAAAAQVEWAEGVEVGVGLEGEWAEFVPTHEWQEVGLSLLSPLSLSLSLL